MLREREHGNLEHLLVMPLQPYELMFAKIWANGLVVVVAAMASLFLVVKGALGVPVAGSIPLFALGLCIYLFSVTALGIMLATLVRSMPQFGLLAFPVFIVMNLLVRRPDAAREHAGVRCRRSCSSCPRRISSAFSQAVLFRERELQHGVAGSGRRCSLIGCAYTVFTLSRFRKMLAAVQ